MAFEPRVYPWTADNIPPYDTYTVNNDCKRLTFTPAGLAGGNYYVKTPNEPDGSLICAGTPFTIEAVAAKWFRKGTQPIAIQGETAPVDFVVKEE